MQRQSNLLFNHQKGLTRAIRYPLDLMCSSYTPSAEPSLTFPSMNGSIVLIWEKVDKDSYQRGRISLKLYVSATAIFSDTSLAIGDGTGQVHFYNIQNLCGPKLEVTIPAAPELKTPINSLAPYGDNEHYFAGFNDGMIALFNRQSKACLTTFAPSLGAPVFIFMDDERLNYIAGNTRGNYVFPSKLEPLQAIVTEVSIIPPAVARIIYGYWREPGPQLFSPTPDETKPTFNDSHHPVRQKGRW